MKIVFNSPLKGIIDLKHTYIMIPLFAIKFQEHIYTVVIQLYGALGYKTHPQFGNFIIACFQTENIAKILGYKAHRCLGSKDQSSLL